MCRVFSLMRSEPSESLRTGMCVFLCSECSPVICIAHLVGYLACVERWKRRDVRQMRSEPSESLRTGMCVFLCSECSPVICIAHLVGYLACVERWKRRDVRQENKEGEGMNPVPFFARVYYIKLLRCYSTSGDTRLPPPISTSSQGLTCTVMSFSLSPNSLPASLNVYW